MRSWQAASSAMLHAVQCGTQPCQPRGLTAASPCTTQAEATAQRKTLQEKRREARRSQLKRNLKRLADSVMRVLQTWNGDSDDDRIDIDQFRTGQRVVGFCAAVSELLRSVCWRLGVVSATLPSSRVWY